MTGSENPWDQLKNTLLTECGLNLQATFRVSDLPAAQRDQINPMLEQNPDSGSLLLLGNGGAGFWQALTAPVWDGPDPLDNRSVELTEAYLRQEFPQRRYQKLYPSSEAVGLQQLGKLAGWHGDSPLKLGINPVFGLWYAYRALFWVEGELPETKPVQFASPCERCVDKPCISSCPADALNDFSKELERCIDYRLAVDSPCQFNCLARVRCPVAPQHRYSNEQIKYHYKQSYETLVRWRS